MAPTLRSVLELPPCFRGIFHEFSFFNPVQSAAFPLAYQTPNANLVLASPTGSGKTGVMELAILSLFSRYVNVSTGTALIPPGRLKVIYVAPSRALVQERYQDWSQRFGKRTTLGLSVQQVTGDTAQDQLHHIETADIICTTPEKLDSMSRRNRDRGGMGYFNDIALILLDEVHLLNEERGAILEAGVVARIKTIASLPEMENQPLASVRFVAVSATLPLSTVRDIAAWLNAQYLSFGDEMRPVPLTTIVRGYHTTIKSDYIFEKSLNKHLWNLLVEFSCGKPALIFCTSRKGTSETAGCVAKEASSRVSDGRPSVLLRDPAQAARLNAAAAKLAAASSSSSSSASSQHLQTCIRLGVAYHHAAMEPAERTIVEDLFKAQDLLVLCTTSTLAVGINLPAHLVIIKSTRRYAGNNTTNNNSTIGTGTTTTTTTGTTTITSTVNENTAASSSRAPHATTGNDRYQELDRSSILQMIGRAGRPQFDTSGTAVIMTQMSTVSKYEGIVNGFEVVESHLLPSLPEFLNAEVVLRTVRTVVQGMIWLKSTFLWQRMRREPGRYGAPVGMGERELEKWMKEELLMKNLNMLKEKGFISIIDDDGDGNGGDGNINVDQSKNSIPSPRFPSFPPITTSHSSLMEPLEPGVIAAEHYINLETVEKMMAVAPSSTMPVLLDVIANSAELSGIKLKRSEKRPLNTINKGGTIKYPLMNPAKPNKVLDRVTETWHKCFVLLNEALKDHHPQQQQLDYSLRQDMAACITAGTRISCAMFRFFSHSNRVSETFNSLLLTKCLKQQMWPSGSVSSREIQGQVSGIGAVIGTRLAEAGITKLSQLAAMDPRRIEAITQKKYPFGNEVLEVLKREKIMPGVDLKCRPVRRLPGGALELEVILSCSAGCDGDSGGGGGGGDDNKATLEKDKGGPSTTATATATIANNNEGKKRAPVSGTQCPVKLLVGTLHDNALLACRSLRIDKDTYPPHAPLVFRVRTNRSAGRVPAVQVVASLVHETLIGVDTAIKTVIPHDACVDEGGVVVQATNGGVKEDGNNNGQQQQQLAQATPLPITPPSLTAIPLPPLPGTADGTDIDNKRVSQAIIKNNNKNISNNKQHNEQRVPSQAAAGKPEPPTRDGGALWQHLKNNMKKIEKKQQQQFKVAVQPPAVVMQAPPQPVLLAKRKEWPTASPPSHMPITAVAPLLAVVKPTIGGGTANHNHKRKETMNENLVAVSVNTKETNNKLPLLPTSSPPQHDLFAKFAFGSASQPSAGNGTESAGKKAASQPQPQQQQHVASKRKAFGGL